jgi:hypothetical protein
MILDIQDGEIVNTNPEHSGIWHNYTVGDAKAVYGHIRFEIIPSAAIVHIIPVYNITVSKLKEIREVNDNILKRVLIDKWGFEEAYIVTDNAFLVKYFSRGVAKEVGEVNTVPMYMVNIKEVLCLKSQQ